MGIPINKSGDKLIINIPGRNLTAEEIALARLIFGETIKYDKVKVFKVDYLPNQQEETIVTPNGNLYPAKKVYRENYALGSERIKHLFIHEMAHVWQNHKGMWVQLAGTKIHACAYLDGTDPYLYNIHQTFGTKVNKMQTSQNQSVSNVVPIKSKLSDYNMESQAEIIADYWALKFKRNPSLMKDKNFETNVRARNLDTVIQIYEEKVKRAINS